MNSIPSYEIVFSKEGKRTFHVPDNVRMLRVDVETRALGKGGNIVDTLVTGNGTQWAYAISHTLDHILSHAITEEYVQVLPNTDYEIEISRVETKCGPVKIMVAIAYSDNINDMVGTLIAD